MSVNAGIVEVRTGFENYVKTLAEQEHRSGKIDIAEVVVAVVAAAVGEPAARYQLAAVGIADRFDTVAAVVAAAAAAAVPVPV